MPNLKDDVRIMSKANEVIGTAEKVSFSVNKAKGMSHPFTANVAVFDYEFNDDVNDFPDVFDIVDIADDGIVQKRTVILNCKVSHIGPDGCAVCVATAPDGV